MSEGIITWYESRPSDSWGVDWYSCLARGEATYSRRHPAGVNAACVHAQKLAATFRGTFTGYRKGYNKP